MAYLLVLLVLLPGLSKTEKVIFGLEVVIVEFADTMEKPSLVLPQKMD
jgi:hypothetical protein